MKIQQEAARVVERTSQYLQLGVLLQRPVWLNVVGSVQPHTDLTKKPKLFENQKQPLDPAQSLHKRKGKYFKTRAASKDVRNHNWEVNRVPKLQFLEDKLRDMFYHQHPWEFSRPKTLVEGSATEFRLCDWSHMLQLTKPLDGESVVQRTLFLLRQAKKSGEKLTLFEAYDAARFEFYQLRMADEMLANVSREESAMYGAHIPTTHVEHGVEQEQYWLDKWVETAAEKSAMIEATRAAQTEVKNEAPETLIWASFEEK